MSFSNDELRECAERELRFRQRVYPRWIQEGRYTADKAMREIAMMETIMLHFSARAEVDMPSLDLFDDPPGG
jgi:hypothetical protein